MVTEDAGLVYDGRQRRRPPGASDFVQELYMLLAEHPAGMTIDDLHSALRDGWAATDAYRAYLNRLKVVPQASPPAYGSGEFKRRAQRWWISNRLTEMRRAGTARREGGRWFTGERAPRVRAPGHRYAALDPARQRANDEAAMAGHIRREQVKAELLAGLNGKPGKDRLRELVQLAYDYLSGRRVT
jgi:hypothetical protein